MKYSLCKHILILSVILSKELAFSQNSNFVNYGMEEGLIMSQIETVIQDQKGYLWIGTIGGLSKYDGVKFTNYTQKNGLAEDWITKSALAKDGSIYFGHWGGGISMWDPTKDTLIDLTLEKHTEFKYITDLLVVGDVLYIATDGAGLLSYDITSKSIRKINIKTPTLQINGLSVDQYNNVWIASDLGVDIYSSTKKSIVKHLDQSNVQQIVQAYNTEMWLASTQGIIKVLYTSNYEIIDTEILSTDDGLTSNNIKTLFADKDQNIWIGTKDQGIIQFNPNKKQEKNKTTQGSLNIFSNKFELKYYHANCFWQDREGNIWVGTELGLTKYMGDLFRVYNHNDNLINNLVWSILEDSKGRLWFGTSEGISIFTFPVIKGKTQYNNPTSQVIGRESGLQDLIVTALFEDTQHRIWAGTENGGIHVIENEKVSKKIGLSEGLQDLKIFSINQDSQGFIWAGSRKGVAKIDPSTFQIQWFTAQDGLGGDKVYHIFKDSKGNLWFGLLGGYLTKYEGETFKVFDEKSGLKAKFILSITEDKDHTLWMSTYGNGIISYKNGAFDTFNVDRGLSSNNTHFITTDNNGIIWIGQSLGIEKYNPKEKTFSLYGKLQGFNGIETNENAVYKDSKGNIWFGTLRGAIKFDPSKDKINAIKPLTYIENIKIFYKNQPLENNATFMYQDNYLTFDVIGISLTNPKEVQYKYWLEGLNNEWSPPTKFNTITFSGLPPGKYTLHVKSINNSGIESSEDILYHFTITPPFWKTWWFYTLCALAIAIGIYFYIKQREQKLKERQAYLEQEVEKRTQELKKEKELVEKQNIEITHKNKNITESISYAKRIQEAILPPLDLVKKALPESFILFKPKDIVSGDFYWLHETDEYTLFAAVDCTGHGVPGAFMSIIGNNLLDKIVKEMHITNPAEILKTLSKELVKTLRQDENAEVKDGMDIAICNIDKKTKSLSFSGAYNPMYIVRNQEIIELKSDKIPIGKGIKTATAIDYTNHTFNLKKDDMLYLFSDGFADQKGGPDSKKFYYPPFRQLLIDISQQSPLSQQKELERKIMAWKGDLEQYDDMLILGVKIQ